MREGLTFVSTLFESCEPYSWYSTEGLEDSKYILFKFSSFLPNFLNRNSPSTNCRNSSGNSPEYSMIVLELGDNFEFFLQFLMVKIDGYIPFFVDLSHGLFGIEMMLLPRLMRFSIKNFSSVREFLITKIFTYVQISSSQGVYIYFWINGCPSMQQSGLSLLLFCMPLYDLLPFLIDCCLCIRNQHCLGWKIFYSYFSLSRGKRLWETDLQNCLNIRNSRFPNIHILFVSTHLALVCTPEIRWADQHPEFILLSSQVHTWEYLVLTGL